MAGITGYAIQLFAPAVMDAADYVLFSVTWSTIFLVGAALGGVQQEVTRATGPMVTRAQPGADIRTYAVCVAAAVAIAIVSFVSIAGGTLFGEYSAAIGVAVLVGGLGYLLLAVISGVFYGLQMWPQAALITVFDSVLRATLVLIGVAAELSPWIIAVMVAVPFSITFLVVFALNRKALHGSFQIDVTLRAMLRNTAQTVGAAIAMGVMITGLPLLLKLWSGSAPQATVATLILGITLTRAPIVVPLVALQGYIVSRAKGLVRIRVRSIALGGLAVLIAGLLLGAAAWLIGPAVIEWLSAGRLKITSPLMAIIAVSALLVATLSVTGSLLLAQSRHRVYAGGWIVAALLTILLLAVPIDFDTRVALALLVSPVVGLLCHLLALLRPVAQERSSAARALFAGSDGNVGE